jgi:hypothetical protein
MERSRGSFQARGRVGDLPQEPSLHRIQLNGFTRFVEDDLKCYPRPHDT